jgi:hypothetical protein
MDAELGEALETIMARLDQITEHLKRIEHEVGYPVRNELAEQAVLEEEGIEKLRRAGP